MKVRRFEKSDAAFLIDIDRKGQEFPFTMEDWEVALNAVMEPDPQHLWRIDVVTVNGTPRGFLFSIFEGNLLFIVRLVVTPSHRGAGLGSTLLDKGFELAREYRMRKLKMIVPETACRGEPGDMGQWLLGKGFKCTKASSSLFNLYGQDWDGLTFELELQ